MKKQLPTFNDGIIFIYKSNAQKASFGATLNVKSTNDLKFIVKLAFEEMSRRDQDFEFAESRGRTLSLKIKTRLYDVIDSSYKAVIDEKLYSIIKIDTDKKSRFLYLYLEEECILNECFNS